MKKIFTRESYSPEESRATNSYRRNFEFTRRQQSANATKEQAENSKKHQPPSPHSLSRPPAPNEITAHSISRLCAAFFDRNARCCSYSFGGPLRGARSRSKRRTQDVCPCRRFLAGPGQQKRQQRLYCRKVNFSPARLFEARQRRMGKGEKGGARSV